MTLLETISGGEDLHLYPTSSESSSIKRKQSHNAYERDRRRKINALYSSLRSLLPQSENKKKLSIPTTVARVLDYMPELQRQVERLERRKDEIVARTRRERDPGGGTSGEGSPVVYVADLGDGEVAIQVCAFCGVGKKGMMSTVMEYLKSEGLPTVSASTLAVDSSRTLFNLHCQVSDASMKLDLGKLRRNLFTVLRRAGCPLDS